MDKQGEMKIKANEHFEVAEEARKQNEYMKACSFYSQATALFRNVGNKDKLKECKQRIVEMNKLSMKHEFKEHSFTSNIEEKKAIEIEKHISKILKFPLSKALEYIGLSPIFCPKIDSITDTANKTMPLTFQLASVYAVDDDGNTIRGSHDGRQQWLMKMYDMQLQFCIKLYFLPIFEKLIRRRLLIRKLSKTKLYHYINRNSIIPEGKQEIIKRGIEAFFKKDFVTTLHILVPQFEAVFLSVCNKIGISTIKIHRGKEIATETITFSEQHLDSDIFREKWGNDFCELVSFLLFRPLGYKIRHKIAHGPIKKEECNFINCVLIIYLYISLSSRVQPITESKQKRSHNSSI